MNEQQVLHVHMLQRRSDRRFGEIAVERGFLSPFQLDELLEEQAEGRLLLGEALVHAGCLSHEGLSEALEAYHEEQMRARRDLNSQLLAHAEEQLLHLETDIASRLLLRLAGLACKVQDLEQGPPRGWAHVFYARGTGEKRFGCAVACDDGILLRVAEGLQAFGSEGPPEAVDPRALRAGSEFVNLLVQYVCRQLSRMGTQVMALPAGETLADEAGLSWTTAHVVVPHGDAFGVALGYRAGGPDAPNAGAQ